MTVHWPDLPSLGLSIAVTVLSSIGWTAGTTPAPATGAPAPGHGTDVYFVHGYNAASCGVRWNADIVQFGLWGWKGRLHTVGYYARDVGCSDPIAGKGIGKNASIERLGRDLANYLYRHHSRRHESVDLVGHSMGGLVIRAALAGVAEHRSGFPPYVYVANAVTMETPHRGVDARYWTVCPEADLQCEQMNPTYPAYAYVRDLPLTPQGRGGTDWSMIGASDDPIVRPGSALGTAPASPRRSKSNARAAEARKGVAPHTYHYLAGQGLGHSTVRQAIGSNGRYRLGYRAPGMLAARYTERGWSPVYAAFRACRDPRAW